MKRLPGFIDFDQMTPEQLEVLIRDKHRILSTNALFKREDIHIARTVVLTKADDKTLDQLVKYLRKQGYESNDYIMIRHDQSDSDKRSKPRGGIIHCLGDLDKKDGEAFNLLKDIIKGDRYAIVLDPSNRYSNRYSCEAVVNTYTRTITYTIVGGGFNVADIRRSNYEPHQQFAVSYQPIAPLNAENFLEDDDSGSLYIGRKRYDVQPSALRAFSHKIISPKRYKELVAAKYMEIGGILMPDERRLTVPRVRRFLREHELTMLEDYEKGYKPIDVDHMRPIHKGVLKAARIAHRFPELIDSEEFTVGCFFSECSPKGYTNPSGNRIQTLVFTDIVLPDKILNALQRQSIRELRRSRGPEIRKIFSVLKSYYSFSFFNRMNSPR